MEIIPIFLFIKFLAYCGVGFVFKRMYGLNSDDEPRVVGVGILRVIIGIIAGVTYTFTVAPFLDHAVPAQYFDVLFYMGLVVLRLGEWSLLLRFLFFKKLELKRDWKSVVLGTVVSCLLDALVIGMVGDRRLVC